MPSTPAQRIDQRFPLTNAADSRSLSLATARRRDRRVGAISADTSRRRLINFLLLIKRNRVKCLKKKRKQFDTFRFQFDLMRWEIGWVCGGGWLTRKRRFPVSTQNTNTKIGEGRPGTTTTTRARERERKGKKIGRCDRQLGQVGLICWARRC